jgi:sec-independent protein translocase protein TatC
MSPDPSVDDGRSLLGAEPLVAEEDDRSRMTFLEHLDELRRRIVYSLYALVASCVVALVFVNDMYEYMTAYFSRYGGQLIYTEPMGGFMFSLKIAVLAGVVLASPFVFSQLWLFVAPGLYAREKRVVIPFVFISSVLFFGGASFAHFIGYPYMWQFFASYDTAAIDFLPDIKVTFAFYSKVVIAMGLVFQMPVLVFFMARFGVVTARFMVAKFKYAVLIIVVLAAVITPSGDAVTLSVFAAPMLVLYCVSIGVAWLTGKKRAARLAAEDD